MKWGVRKDKYIARKKQTRKSDYEARKKAASHNRSMANKYSKELSDLNNKGFDSEYWKNNTDYSKDWKEVFDSKEQAKKHLMNEYKTAIKDRKTEAYNWDKLAKSIKETPINKKTYAEITRDRNKIRDGALKIGSILGVAGSTAIGVATRSSSIGLASAYISGILGIGVTSKIGTTEIDQYNKYNKNKLKKPSSRETYLY